MGASLGLIRFPDNPWPAGHEVTSLRWTGRLDPGAGLWFGLRLETARYFAAGASDLQGDGDAAAGDWGSRIVWENYHSCKIAANKGFLVGSEDAPLSFDRL